METLNEKLRDLTAITSSKNVTEEKTFPQITKSSGHYNVVVRKCQDTISVYLQYMPIKLSAVQNLSRLYNEEQPFGPSIALYIDGQRRVSTLHSLDDYDGMSIVIRLAKWSMSSTDLESSLSPMSINADKIANILEEEMVKPINEDMGIHQSLISRFNCFLPAIQFNGGTASWRECQKAPATGTFEVVIDDNRLESGAVLEAFLHLDSKLLRDNVEWSRYRNPDGTLELTSWWSGDTPLSNTFMVKIDLKKLGLTNLPSNDHRIADHFSYWLNDMMMLGMILKDRRQMYQNALKTYLEQKKEESNESKS